MTPQEAFRFLVKATTAERVQRLVTERAVEVAVLAQWAAMLEQILAATAVQV
jgi:hypothetical protein